MKKRIMILAATAAITGVTVTGCGSSKPVSVTKVNQEQEISVPCAEYFTDGNFFRGVGVGQSKDMNTAREKARMAANTELAGSISTTIKQVSEKYVNDAGQSQADYGETFEALTKQVINQQLNSLEVCCSKTTRTQDGLYKMYIAVQADAKKVFGALDRSAAADKKLETMYNREKFRANYDAEMAAFAQKQ